MHALRPLEDRLGVRFHDSSLLLNALTHRSVLNERPGELAGDNERLEFLGDAILGALVADVLFHAFPDSAEGALTFMRAEIVRQSGLARLARQLELGVHLILGRGEEQRGGKERDALLASAFEAVVGAIYLDSGYAAARDVLESFIVASMPDVSAPSRAQDPKSELQHRIQATLGALPSYRVVEVEGPEHRPTFTVEVAAADAVLASGSGSSKQAAEQEAARLALEAWADPSATDDR